MIFKQVREGRPYPAHKFSRRDWARIPPHLVRLDQLVTTQRALGLDRVLAEDSTFYGDLFPHAVQWKGELYLEDGLHRCLRAALQQRTSVHVRVLNLDELSTLKVGGSATGTGDRVTEVRSAGGLTPEGEPTDGMAVAGRAAPEEASDPAANDLV